MREEGTGLASPLFLLRPNVQFVNGIAVPMQFLYPVPVRDIELLTLSIEIVEPFRKCRLALGRAHRCPRSRSVAVPRPRL